jgi:hypothetical protein
VISNSAPTIQISAESKQGRRSELHQYLCEKKNEINKFLGPINFGNSNDLLTGYELFNKEFSKELISFACYIQHTRPGSRDKC